MSDTAAITDSLVALNRSRGTYAAKQLAPAKTPSAIPARTGASLPIIAATGGGGTGTLTGHFIEDVTGGREYYAERPMKTTDGVVYGKYTPIRQLNMHDDASNVVVFTFQDQPAP